MKKIQSLFVFMMTLAITVQTLTFSVFADTATDLESMKVYAVDASGTRTEVPMEFSSTTYEYDLTVLSNVASIAIEAKTADSSSTWSIEKDGINTKMDTGNNVTVVDVKSNAGAIQKYTLKTKKLTAAEEETYEAPTTSSEDEAAQDGENAKKNDDDTVVKVGKKSFKIATSFDDSVIPAGFKKSSAKYDGKKYPCIKGEVKDLKAFYLYNDDTEGFYTYDSETKELSKMHNVKIKSRMYTIVSPKETDACLKNYSKKNVNILGEKVKAWVLDAEEGMYLVYAMNWNGETELYCYDDSEKCFQRYLPENDTNTQMEAANTAYENLQNKYNNLVEKYNLILKILCALIILAIILVFVIVHMALNRKEKRMRKAQEEGDYSKDLSIDEDSYEEFEDDEKEPAHFEKIAKKNGYGRTYGDEPTFGTADVEVVSDEGFYGGEVAGEAEVLIDITDDSNSEDTEESKEEKSENEVVDTKESDNEVAEDKVEDTKEDVSEDIAAMESEAFEEQAKQAQLEEEATLRETIGSMIPEEENEPEEIDDDDFEFIDLN